MHEWGMDPDECAERILRAAERGKRETLVGGLEVYTVHMNRFFPATFEALLRNHPVKRLNRLKRLFSFRKGGSS